MLELIVMLPMVVMFQMMNNILIILFFVWLSSIKPPRGDSWKFRSRDLKLIDTKSKWDYHISNWKEYVPQATLNKNKI